MNSQFIALRFEHLRYDEDGLHQALSELEITRYSLCAQDEDAPSLSHCITAVRYIISIATGYILPHVYIGDFIHDMTLDRVAGARLIPLEEHDRGDLLFFHRRSTAHKVHMIAHVGIFTDDSGNYFHSSPKGGKVDNISKSLIHGTIVTCHLAMRKTDPRKT